MKHLRGTGIALITPFNDDYTIDFDGLENLIEYAIDGGVNFLVLLGTTAESVTLTEKEKEMVISFCKRINRGRLPIVIGIGGNNTFAKRIRIRCLA